MAPRFERKKKGKKEVNKMNSEKRVLIVDDEPNVLDSVSKILSRKGFETVTSKNGEDALRQIKNEKYDLVVADLMMPKVSGIDLLKAVKNENKEIAFLVITGYPSINTAVEATKYGAGGFLPKPFTPTELEEAVEKALGGTKEYQSVDTLPKSEQIDVDMPFDAREVARATSNQYVESLTRTELPVVHTQQKESAADYCPKGQRSCKKYVKTGECKDVCPFVAKAQKNLSATATKKLTNDPIDVDMPFSMSEVAEIAGEAYALSLGPSDMPIVGHYQQALKAANAPKVLIIDDEAVVVNSVRKTLEKRGFVVEGVFNSREAIEKAQSSKYNLILVDMKLGNENGLDLIPQLKKLAPETSVVVLTGFASIDSAVESVRRGADDYMAKPFTPEELYTMTNKNLKVA
jgi:DNA-binding NtrC family response regulator